MESDAPPEAKEPEAKPPEAEAKEPEAKPPEVNAPVVVESEAKKVPEAKESDAPPLVSNPEAEAHPSEACKKWSQLGKLMYTDEAEGLRTLLDEINRLLEWKVKAVGGQWRDVDTIFRRHDIQHNHHPDHQKILVSLGQRCGSSDSLACRHSRLDAVDISNHYSRLLKGLEPYGDIAPEIHRVLEKYGKAFDKFDKMFDLQHERLKKGATHINFLRKWLFLPVIRLNIFRGGVGGWAGMGWGGGGGAGNSFFIDCTKS